MWINGLKPTLAEIIRQGIQLGEITFDDPASLAEIVLIVLTVKLDNTIAHSDQQDVEAVIRALVSLLEKGTENSRGIHSEIAREEDVIWNNTKNTVYFIPRFLGSLW